MIYEIFDQVKGKSNLACASSTLYGWQRYSVFNACEIIFCLEEPDVTTLLD
jgi:hypothetical protein